MGIVYERKKMIRCLVAILMLVSVSRVSGQREPGVWLFVKNESEGDLNEIVLSKKHSLGDVESGGSSKYQKFEGLHRNGTVKAIAGGKVLLYPGRDIAEDELLADGYYQLTLRVEDGVLKAVCEDVVSYKQMTASNEAVDDREPSKDEILINGAVKKPGFYPADMKQQMTLESVLRLAGGALDGDYLHTPVASLRNVQLRRKVNGKWETHKLDAQTYRKSGKDREFLVRPGDVIEVPYCL